MLLFTLWTFVITLFPKCLTVVPGISKFHSPMRVSESDSPSWESQVMPYSNEANSYAYWNCHTIPPNMTLCKSVGYSRMVLPNFLQHESIREVIQQANVWVALVNTDCHPDIQRFLCSLYAPVCLKSHHESKIPPCWELCEQVRNACLPRMRHFGFDWPEIVQCGQFPRLAESMCISPEENIAVKCSPCEQTLSMENLASSYCMADVVLKASILDVVPEADRTSLKLVLGPKTRALKLIRKDGTMSTNSDVQRLWKRSRKRRHNRRLARSRIYRHAESSRITGTGYSAEPVGWDNLNISYVYSLLNRVPRSSPNRTDPSDLNTGWDEQPDRISPRSTTKRIRRVRNLQLLDLDGITELQLGCSACSGLTPFVNKAGSVQTNSKRWLVMGRRIFDNKSRIHTNKVQVTLLTTFDQKSPEFKRTLNAIRTQPVARLCPKVAPVEPDLNSALSGQPGLEEFPDPVSELSDSPDNIRSQTKANDRQELLSKGKKLGPKADLRRKDSPTALTQTNRTNPSNKLTSMNGTPSNSKGTSKNTAHSVVRLLHNVTPAILSTSPIGSRVMSKENDRNKNDVLGHQGFGSLRNGPNIIKRPTYEDAVGSLRQNQWLRNGPRPVWYQSDLWNTQERRRRRRHERRQWKKKQKEAEMQQNRRELNRLDMIPLRQKPINPYVNEEPDSYSSSYWYPKSAG